MNDKSSNHQLRQALETARRYKEIPDSQLPVYKMEAVALLGEIERLSARNVALEQGLRKASERFGWLSAYHLTAKYSQTAARELMDEFWKLQAGEITSVETSHCIDCIELKNALASAVGIANEARECYNRDQDMRAMKILIALSGYLPKYRADTDRIHDVLKRAVERLSAPMPPEEPSPVKAIPDPDPNERCGYCSVKRSLHNAGGVGSCGNWRPQEKASGLCVACGHHDQYHFDDGKGNVVCRWSETCVCIHRTESITPENGKG